MDLALALSPLSDQPAQAQSEWVTLRGAMAPVIIARPWLDDATAAEWLVKNPYILAAHQLQAALDAQQYEQAWQLVTPDRLSDSHLRQIMELWASRQAAELKLQADKYGIFALGWTGPQQRRITVLGGNVSRDVGHQFGLGAWPPWSGGLVIVAAEVTTSALHPDQAYLSRPALPMLRFDHSDASQREQIARGMAQITLNLLDPQAQAPRWLSDAMVGVAMARARGEGPSPRAMHAIRRAAGALGLQELLLDQHHDAELATAIGAYLCHRQRARFLPNFIELLRNQVDSVTALKIAYGLSLNDLLERR